jgi:hypothetical protein
LRAFQIKWFVVIAILSIGIRATCQNKIATIKISQVRSEYVDRPGDLYILQQDDSLTKFDLDGKFVEKSSLKSVSNFEPRDGSRCFLYYKSSQRFGFFARMEGITHTIQQEYAIEPIMACSSGENQAWILDRADWSLKRIDPFKAKVIADAVINQKQFDGPPEFIFMREYQNFLFLIEKSKGIIIFNNLGHQIKNIVDSEITNLNFLGEELYYKKGDKLFFYDLFDGSTRDLPIDRMCKAAILTDVRKFVVYDDRIEIFENP